MLFRSSLGGQMANRSSGPEFVRLFAPLLDTLRDLGNSGRPATVYTIVLSLVRLVKRTRWQSRGVLPLAAFEPFLKAEKISSFLFDRINATRQVQRTTKAPVNDRNRLASYPECPINRYHNGAWRDEVELLPDSIQAEILFPRPLLLQLTRPPEADHVARARVVQLWPVRDLRA